jgi:hypothetical protein
MLKCDKVELLLVRKDLLDSSDPAIIQSHLDPARVMGGRRQDILYNPDRSFAGPLIGFQNDFDALTGANVLAILAVHMGSDTLLGGRVDICVFHGSLGSWRRTSVTRRQV